MHGLDKVEEVWNNCERSCEEQCFQAGRLPNKFLGALFCVATLFSIFLLVVAAVEAADIGPISWDIVDDSSLPANATRGCGTNDNTQIYCTGVAFSLISGSGGLLLGAGLLWCLARLQTMKSDFLLAMFLLASICISLGLWCKIESISSDPVGSLILAVNATNLAVWSFVAFVLVYSPLPEEEKDMLPLTPSQHKI